MCKKKIIFLLLIILLVPSCNTWDSVKRGITGEKQNSTDEFLVRKKDPLILPPDFENLPTPGEREVAQEEASIFEKEFSEITTTENSSLESSSTEESILKKIQKK